MLRAVGAGAGLSLVGGQTATAVNVGGDGSRWDPTSPTGAPGIDSLFGWASGGPDPCMGDAPADCVEEAHPSVSVDTEVEVRIDIPGLAFAAGSQGVLSEKRARNINEAVGAGRSTGASSTGRTRRWSDRVRRGPGRRRSRR